MNWPVTPSKECFIHHQLPSVMTLAPLYITLDGTPASQLQNIFLCMLNKSWILMSLFASGTHRLWVLAQHCPVLWNGVSTFGSVHLAWLFFSWLQRLSAKSWISWKKIQVQIAVLWWLGLLLLCSFSSVGCALEKNFEHSCSCFMYFTSSWKQAPNIGSNLCCSRCQDLICVKRNTHSWPYYFCLVMAWNVVIFLVNRGPDAMMPIV